MHKSSSGSAEEASELDGFFNAGGGNKPPGGPAPPPPAGVDTREFFSHTAGGFGNTPSVSNSTASTAASGLQPPPFPLGAPQSSFAPGEFGASRQTSPLGFAVPQSINDAFSMFGENQTLAGSSQYFQQNLKPWKDFLLPVALPQSGPGALDSCQKNVRFFRTNYVLLFLGYFALNALTTPSILLLLGLLALFWVWFAKKNADPAWVVEVGGVQVAAAQRWFFAVCGTGLLVVYFCGGLLFSCGWVFLVIMLLHGVIHSTEGMVLDEGVVLGSEV